MKHRTFNADRFLDKFEGQEPLLRNFVGRWNGQLGALAASLDVRSFKDMLVDPNVGDKGPLLEDLYRAYDLCTEEGHEDLVSACRDAGYDPDPQTVLPVECLALKILTEKEDAFDLAYDKHTLLLAERFAIYKGASAKAISDIPGARTRLQARLADTFRADKNSDRVIIRAYRERSYVNFVVYHEKRTKAELTFKGTGSRMKISPTLLRPAQQDFISYNETTGQVEIEARFEKEEEVIRKSFAACCLDNENFFEGAAAAERLDLTRIAQADFALPVDADHEAKLVELHFNLKQKHMPSVSLRSKDVLETLENLHMRRRLESSIIRRAVIKVVFPDDARGKRIDLNGANHIRFKRATHAEQVFKYLKDWGILLA